MANDTHKDALQVGTLKCPEDETRLHFKIFQGMRIRYDDHYSAYCPHCKRYYNVKAPKEPA